MEIIVYLCIFMIGAFIGSFASLAVYRLPLKQDILYTHSYCPNCKEKLKIIDLVPIFSYILLRGKCRNCGQKIRPRYLILEVFSGIITLLFVLSTGFNIYNIDLHLIIEIIFYVIFITTLVLVAGIDKEYNKLQKSIIVFGLILEIVYLFFSFSILKLVLLMLLLAIIILNKDYYILDLLAIILYTLFFVPIQIGIINLVLLLMTTPFVKKNWIFTYIIITITTLIISNFLL